MSASRRAFLRGRFSAPVDEIRPPWAIGRSAFELRCDRCEECIRACPTGILRAGDGGFPTVSFESGECTFCGDCEQVCKPGALERSEQDVPWSLKVRIGDACLADRGVECRVCGEACGAGAIRFRPRIGGVARPETDPAVCNGCGACHAPCPVRAIAMERHQ
ncbi:MAG: ferredoxin-type protein NapF [Rhodocyclaceae bacterium]|nr:ferredoxin-type protein NapF [Rhodocyclaceae bacterium]MCL4758225.1 ferredoxin-type protein NapF [Rhodocyclaceae bacterium]